MTARDQLFLRFVKGLFIIMVLYGAGMVIVIVTSAYESLSRSMIAGFASMFAGVLGLGSGYLLGRGANGNGKSNGNHS